MDLPFQTKPLKILNFPFPTEAPRVRHHYPVVTMTPALREELELRMNRASGDACCPVCGYVYYDHPYLAWYRCDAASNPEAFMDGMTVVSCEGKVLHL